MHSTCIKCGHCSNCSETQHNTTSRPVRRPRERLRTKRTIGTRVERWQSSRAECPHGVVGVGVGVSNRESSRVETSQVSMQQQNSSLIDSMLTQCVIDCGPDSGAVVRVVRRTCRAAPRNALRPTAGEERTDERSGMRCASRRRKVRGARAGLRGRFSNLRGRGARCQLRQVYYRAIANTGRRQRRRTPPRLIGAFDARVAPPRRSAIAIAPRDLPSTSAINFAPLAADARLAWR